MIIKILIDPIQGTQTAFSSTSSSVLDFLMNVKERQIPFHSAQR